MIHYLGDSRKAMDGRKFLGPVRLRKDYTIGQKKDYAPILLALTRARVNFAWTCTCGYFPCVWIRARWMRVRLLLFLLLLFFSEQI